MALEWKKVLTTGDNTNIGNSNLTTPASSGRVLQLGNSASLNIQSSDSVSAFKVTKTSCFLGGPSSEETSLVSGKSGTEGAKLKLATSGTQTSSATLSNTNSLRVRNHSNTAASASTLFLERIPADENGLSNGEVVGTISFDGKVDQTANGAPDNVVPFASITGTAVNSQITEYSPAPNVNVLSHTTEGKLGFTVRRNENDFLAAEITADGYGSGGNASTDNELKLKSLKLAGTSLETLTRRNLITIQCGTNGTITASSGGTAAQPLKMVNGVLTVAGTTLSSAHGIVLPFGGYVVGGSFSCQRDTPANQGANVSLLVRRVFGNTAGTSHHDIRVATNTGTALPSQIVSDSYPIDSTNHRSSGNTGFKFDAGDVLVPILEVDADTGDTTTVEKVIAQIFIYTESIVA